MDAVSWPVVGSGLGWAYAVALTTFVIRAVVRGDFIPRSTHEREMERAEHDANEWRAEGRIKDAQIAEKDKQLSHMGEVGKTVNAFISSIQNAARTSRDTS